ncbi:TerB N-terminal domain-containing protein [Jinshanibacter sp. LJY008]|uniref:TerB N-terminal domain-containing protein n=1 Tax=Limnobaculum eriocheiris TaxID=2897391 RepID=A0A9X1SPQ3_9GAMM|nr:TerB N-terminal domain-containing protein [Limnobaculum eriocheiris]MCD1126292.1 TerB N-terminal domain-containing protein [Limnobaculum eriocheiris]
MDFWIFIFALVVIWFLFFKKKKSTVQRTNSKNITKMNNTFRQKSSNKSINSVASMHSQTSDDDELATFTVINGQTVEYRISREQQSREIATRCNTMPARWVKPGEIITIQDTVISHGNFYFGGQLKIYSSGEYGHHYNDGTDASLVNDALPIQHISKHYQDESLGYWPSFSTLSPRCRGAYLDWLASDRSDSSCPVGYVFIYFYGLERRILVDGTQETISDDEFKSLFEEVLRLRAVFLANNSFRHYSTQLIEVMLLLRPGVIQFENEKECFVSGSSLLFQFRLATTVAQGKPLSADLALAWVKYYPEYTLRTPARRCADEFAALFKLRYVNKFSGGLVVKPNKTSLKLTYLPASSTLRGIGIEHPDLPDPSVLRAPVQKLIQIAESCTGALDAYSRYLGKKEAERSDIAAIMLLPNEILSEEAEHMFAGFKNWADERIRENSGLVTVTDFWARLDMSVPAKMNKKEAELMQNFVQRVGYGIAPDTRYHHAKPESDGNIVLFSEGHGEFFTPSSEFQSMSVAIRLGAMVAQIDKVIDISEQAALEKVIDHNDRLSPTEKRSLYAYLIWRLNTPASMAGLKARIGLLQDKEKSVISNVIISVACADGRIDSAEIKQLEKIYASLGLDSSTVTSDLHRLSTAEKVAPATLPTTSETRRTFSLDERILARHESDTTDVRQLLNTIFSEDESIEELSIDTPSHPGTGLDEAHYQLYQCLLEKERWSRSEVTALCQQFNLMVSGAIEAINDWSFEQVDAPILDDDDDIYVDLEIAQELKG